MTAPPKHNNGTHGGAPLERIPPRVVTRHAPTSSDCAPVNFRLTPTFGEVALTVVMT